MSVRPLVVLKFGGAALATPKRVRGAARRVAHWRREGWSPVVVVSACGRTTDRILRWLRAGTGRVDVAGREADRALSAGERMAAGLLAAALEARGVPAVSLEAGEAGVRGAGRHGEGRITSVRARVLGRRIEEGLTPVVAGFQAVDAAGEILTIGRGGSDLTAVHLAGALGAEECHLVKDVPGIHDRDPREHPSARLLPRLHPGEVRRMALEGARIVHPDAARVAEELGIRLRIYGFDDPVFGEHGSTVAAGNGDGPGAPSPRESAEDPGPELEPGVGWPA